MYRYIDSEMEVAVGSALFQLALFVAVVSRPTYRALTAGRPDRVAAWAAAQGLDVTAANQDALADDLRRTGRWRAAGALVGLGIAIVVPELEIRVYRGPRPGGNIGFLDFWAVALGYLAGVLVGEFGRRRPPGTARRVASLSPRELAEYVPPVARRWLAWGAGASVGAGVAFLLLPMHDSATVGRAVVAVVPPVGAVAFAFAAPRLARWLLHRAQRAGTPLEIAADDALRSAGARAVVAAAVVLVLVSLAVELFAVSLTDVEFLRWTGWMVGLVALGLAYRAWRALVEPGAWRVRRPPLQGRPA
ncbi:MAG: hypothetical protein QOG82_2708 [Actinomycetota bacterium]|jgi:hypothetical protein|nr:hypothetical protein [Actinomycetota bacterium]